MIVLDTNVLSEEMKPAPDAAVHRWLLAMNASDLFTSAVTEAEIRLGIAILPDGKRKQDLEAAASRILALSAGRVLPFDSAAAVEYARIVAERRRMGRPVADFDAQIAATTLSRDMMLATRNGTDFVDSGVGVVDPWTTT